MHRKLFGILQMFVAQALFSNVCCPGLVLYSDGYFDGYDPTVNPGAGEVLDTELYKCVVYMFDFN